MGNIYNLLNSFGNLKTKIIKSFRCMSTVSFINNKKLKKLEKVEKRVRFLSFSLLAIPVLTLSLGTWQIQRRKWKLNLLEEIRSKFNLQPRNLPTNLNDLKDMEYVPFKEKGTYMHSKELIIGPKSLIVDNMELSEKNKTILSNSMKRGYNVITPFKLENRNLIILVNRGWVPDQYKDSSKRPLTQFEGLLEITGVLRLSERKPTFVPKNKPQENVWYYRDVKEMADLLDADPVFLDLIETNRKPDNPIISGQTKVSLRNEHLSYAITWYSLSLTTGYLWYRIFIKKLPLL